MESTERPDHCNDCGKKLASDLTYCSDCGLTYSEDRSTKVPNELQEHKLQQEFNRIKKAGEIEADSLLLNAFVIAPLVLIALLVTVISLLSIFSNNLLLIMGGIVFSIFIWSIPIGLIKRMNWIRIYYLYIITIIYGIIFYLREYEIAIYYAYLWLFSMYLLLFHKPTLALFD